MNTELFIPIKFVSSINLKPYEINDKIEDIFLNKIKKKYEGMCTKHGYIKKDSIKIVKRSIGSFIQEHFNSSICYTFQCSAEIFNPTKGSIIKAIVQNKNEMGILAKSFYNNEAILEVIVPKISAGIKSDIDLNSINIGDEIYVEIFGKKFVLYDKLISIIGKAINSENLKLDNNNMYYEEDEDDDDEREERLDENFDELDEDVQEKEDKEDEDEESEESSDDNDEDEDEIDDDDIIEDDYDEIEETIFDD
jgi:DNA-directed RNA polymerase subunit E'/Rpb7